MQKKIMRCLLANICSLLFLTEAVTGCFTDSWCSTLYDSKPYCCRNGDCCSTFEHAAETGTKLLTLSVGVIVGIVVGSIVLLVACIVGCVCCCCNKGRTSQGTVITTSPQPVILQQNPGVYPTSQAYPPQGQHYPPPASPGYYPPTGVPPAYDTKAADGPAY